MGEAIITKDKKKKRKGRGPMNLIKVVLYMMKGNKKSSCLPSATNATLNNLVGSFRPFHLQSGVAPLPAPKEIFEVSPPPRHSKSSSSLSSSSSKGDLSRYASAQSLYDLDNHDAIQQEDDGDSYYDGLEGDEMIDTKAEMFIAKFYQQMRLQDRNI